MQAYSYRQDENDTSALETKSVQRFIGMLFLGFLLIFLGMAFITASIVSSNSGKDVAIVIFIGPIPLIFGAGPHVLIVVAFSIFIAFIMFLLLILSLKKT